MMNGQKKKKAYALNLIELGRRRVFAPLTDTQSLRLAEGEIGSSPGDSTCTA